MMMIIGREPWSLSQCETDAVINERPKIYIFTPLTSRLSLPMIRLVRIF